MLGYEGQLRVVRSPQGLGWGSCQVNTGAPAEPPILLLVSGLVKQRKGLLLGEEPEGWEEGLQRARVFKAKKLTGTDYGSWGQRRNTACNSGDPWVETTHRAVFSQPKPKTGTKARRPAFRSWSQLVRGWGETLGGGLGGLGKGLMDDPRGRSCVLSGCRSGPRFPGKGLGGTSHGGEWMKMSRGREEGVGGGDTHDTQEV